MYRPSALHALRPSQFQLPVCTSQEPPEVPVFTGGALENCSLSRRGKTWGKLTAGRVPHWKCKRNRPPFVLILLIFVEKLLQGPPFTSQLQNSIGTAAIFLRGICLMPWNYSLPETRRTDCKDGQVVEEAVRATPTWHGRCCAIPGSNKTQHAQLNVPISSQIAAGWGSDGGMALCPMSQATFLCKTTQ